METAFVTGANGLVGSNLCHKLSELGYTVVAMVRGNSDIVGLSGFRGKKVQGDIMDSDSLVKLIEGSDYVFHTAGLVSFDNRRRKELLRINVEGTRNVMQAARKANVKKVVHTSSVAAIGIPRSGVEMADESTEYNKFRYRIAYADSKHLGEMEVRKAVDSGLDAVIINPASIVGPRDVYSHFGVLLKLFKDKKIVPYVPGGMCVVDVDDVVSGEISALKSGRSGERYIIGGENLSFKELFAKIAGIVNASPPNLRIPIWAARCAASIFEILSAITGKPPVLTKAHVASATLPHYYSFAKAKRELGIEPHPIDRAIQKAYEWYEDNGLM